MKRILILAASAAIAVLTLTLISAVVAAPGAIPFLQTSETEPNDSFDDADERGSVAVPGYVTGVVSETDVVDYFLIDTDTLARYKTSLNITSNKGALTLNMKLYNSERNFLDDNKTSISWTAYQDSHYVLVEALLATTTTVQIAEYRLSVERLAGTPTPTDTPLPTDTPTPTATPSEPTGDDKYEDNDRRADAYALPVQTSVSLSDLDGLANFYPAGDEDWFKFWTKDEFWYEATTSDLNRVDTYVEVKTEDGEEVEEDDDGGGGYASRAQWEAKYDGYYYIRVTNKVETTGEYNLEVEEVSAPATKTPGPSPTPGVAATPRGQADDCEDNLDFHHACVLAVNRAQTFNFVPVYGEGPDNDFFKIWVKSGLHFRCETSDLSPGLDPNMIMFNGPSWDNVIAGNDDIEKGNYNSALIYYATYEGWLYVLVGTGDRTPPDITDSSYTLLCENSTEPFSAPGTPHPTATPEAPTPAPDTPTPTSPGSPVVTPTPEAGQVTVRPLTTPTPAAPVTPSPRFVPIRLLVYYDGNGDGQPGAGEGIAGISAQAYEVASNELLAQDFTDEQGSLEFTVSAQGPVRISIPFLAFSHLVTGAEASIQVRVPPRALPGGTP